MSANLSVLPSQGKRQQVASVLNSALDRDFDEVVLLGFKDGQSYLFQSKIADTPKIVGAIEWIKHRLMEDHGNSSK